MKYLVIFILLTFYVPTIHAQKSIDCGAPNDLVNTIENIHYKPRELNDSLSADIFNNFIESLDPESIFFSSEDIVELTTFEYALDTEIREEKCLFINKVSDIYKAKLQSYLQELQSFSTIDFDFQISDTYQSPERNQSLTENELKANWKSLAKLKILYRYFYNQDTLQNQDTPTNALLNTLKTNIIERELCKVQAIINYEPSLQHYVQEYYLKAIASCYDPHTAYLTKADNQNFSDALSKDKAAFGISYKRNDVGEIEITNIIPGSPAWNSGLINEGDVLLNVSYHGERKDLNCLHLKELSQLLNSVQNDPAIFHIRKRNGQERDVSLKKKIIDVQSNVINSFVLDGSIKAGYIYLPSFYSDDSYFEPKGCANDLATELIKLKRENIKGLILDLRNNGGGSMYEAIQLAGIFINYGAITLVDSREGDITTYKDFNRGSIYRDPLIILTNQLSASASELLAAALQDQNRALIVGNRTYGKSTVQDIYPINAHKKSIPANTIADNYVKITISKFYRVTGESHQNEGVIPDIILPGLYDSLGISESNEPFTLPNTSVNKKTYYFPSDTLPKNILADKSRARIKDNEKIKAISEKSKEYALSTQPRTINVSIAGFPEYYKHDFTELLEAESSKYFTVANPNYIKGMSGIYDRESEVNKSTMKDIATDAYIEESYLILKDLLLLKQSE